MASINWNFSGRLGYTMISIIAASLLLSVPAEAQNEFIVLSYHSIPERYHGDPMSISVSRFVEQVEWLKDQGYTAVSLDQVIKSNLGKSRLPARSFMITVDDGYEDVYTKLFPLLKRYKYPAVIALVGKWMEEKQPSKNETDPYFLRQKFLSWAQIKEMTQSGLIEIASHSYDLHHGIIANPQGNTQPAAVTLQFKDRLNTYESLAQRRTRIRIDLERNSNLIERNLGYRPRAMVWPYGAYDRITIEESARAGMRVNFSLDAGQASTSNIEIIPRFLVNKEMSLSTFSYIVQHADVQSNIGPVHAIKLNLDRIFDVDPEIQNQNLGRLIEQVRSLGVNTVVLQPFVTPTPSANIEAVYFPNSVLPMRADLLNRVAWQLKSRLGLSIYTQASISNISIVEERNSSVLNISNAAYRKRLFRLYEELGNHTPFRGIVFLDPASSAIEPSTRQELLKQIRYYRYLPQWKDERNFSSDEINSKYGWDFQGGGQGYPFLLVDVPTSLGKNKVHQWKQNLPNDRIVWLTLPTADLTKGRMRSLIQTIRNLQTRGMRNFLLDDDNFLDDPRKIEKLRSVLSLKNNPYIEVGQ